MPPSLGNLPSELQLSLLCAADDLDDAFQLSRTCKSFFSLYTIHRKTVEREIIVWYLVSLRKPKVIDMLQTLSSVYEYDWQLSKYNNTIQDLAETFLNKSTNIPDEHRPTESVIVDCMNTTWTRKMATDEVIGDIASRWRQLSYLRRLYLDSSIAKEFQLFRLQFASKQSMAVRAKIVKPGVNKIEEKQQRHNFDYDFKARFHQSLCLLSISISSRTLARYAVVDGSRPPHPNHPQDLSDETSIAIEDAWSRHSVIVGGDKRLLSLGTRLDCLEVFDFLYLFLLRKIIPSNRFEGWMHDKVEYYPYSDMTGECSISNWYSFLGHCCWALQPVDLVDLIEHQAWTADAHYPEDKSGYMCIRGMFDLGAPNDSDWYTTFERSSIVHAVLPDGYPYRYTAAESRCWWDSVRLELGSPFQSEFTSAFLAADKGLVGPRFNWQHARDQNPDRENY